MKVTKAVIPAAGLGTRVLPATKAMPKEMLTIVDKPAIQYIVEEAVRSGITDILIITNRGKDVIEDHFDRTPELEAALSSKGRTDIYNEIVDISKMANIYFIRQKETKGLGHAISCARSFVGSEPFAVLYGDDVIMGEDPACAQLIRAYEEYGLGVLGIKEVFEEAIVKYSSLKVEHLKDDHTAPGAGGEIQLTDAMRELARSKGMTGVDFTGKRYDMGNKLGIMQAAVETALKHKEIGEDFKAYLKELAKTL